MSMDSSVMEKRDKDHVSNFIMNINIVNVLCDGILTLTKIEEGRYQIQEALNVNFVKCLNIAKRNAFVGGTFGFEKTLEPIVEGPKHLIITDEKSLVLLLENLIVYVKSIIEEIKSWEITASHRINNCVSLKISLEEDLSHVDTSNFTCPATLNMVVTTTSVHQSTDKILESTAMNLCTSLINVFGGSYEFTNNGFSCHLQLPCRSQTDKSFTDDIDFYKGTGVEALVGIDDSVMKEMLGLKVCVVTCPNGFESCITNLLDKSFHFVHKYSVLSQSSRDTFETFNSFDIVFTQDLKLCKKLKAQHLRGEIVFFHAKLAYLSQDDYKGVCDR
jgi:hypothetical protein